MSEHDRAIQRQVVRDAPARTPDASIGKYTLLDAEYMHPAQRDGEGRDRSQDVLVSQYGPGTTNHKNDCGPACVLMVLKAMGLGDAFRQLVATAYKKTAETVTLQDELDEIRFIGFAGTGDFSMEPLGLRTCLEKVFVALHVPDLGSDAAWRKVLPMLNEENGDAVYKDNHVTAKVQAFLDKHCVDGSAVIVEGHPHAAAWGWGGLDDPHNARRVGDAGLHYVFVWRLDPSQEAFDVLDPSWTAPKTGMTVDRIVEFVTGPVGMFAVPYEQIAVAIPQAARQPQSVRRTSDGIPRLDLKDVATNAK